jgi:hypothetical protein
MNKYIVIAILTIISYNLLSCKKDVKDYTCTCVDYDGSGQPTNSTVQAIKATEIDAMKACPQGSFSHKCTLAVK